MKITVLKSTLASASADFLVLPVFGEKDFDAKKIKDIPPDLRGRFEKAAQAVKFSARPGEFVHLQTAGTIMADDFEVAGIGEKRKDHLTALKETCGGAFIAARRLGMKRMGYFLPKELQKEEYVEGLVLAALLANYAVDTYKKSNAERRFNEFVIYVDDGKTLVKLRKAVERAELIADGVTVARDLTNMPAINMTPTRLAEAAEKIVKASDKTLKLKILNKKECEKLGMGAYLAVSQGSDEEPKFIHLTYTSPRPTKRSIAVVGKGVTFDSGGLSLKPADSMMTMKCDMAGAAAVLGFFATLARLKPRINIHGVIAATENMPSGKAIRPGDVVKSMNGKTIEILNTDAEGRLTLADAITYIIREANPDEIIDLATLTGACVVALGEEVAGLMTNDQKLGKAVLSAAKRAGEKLWEMPLEERYRMLIYSDIADLRNIPTNRYGGSLTAGLFIEEFVEGKPWVHLDIAGPAFAERPLSSYLAKGGTGFGVMTLIDLVSQE
jgi:leucyl aminopeptidase